MQEKLIILRKKRGVTQKQLAEYLGITEKTYGLKERGEFQFTLEEAFKLRDFFGERIEDIFCYKEVTTNAQRSHQANCAHN